LEILGAILGIAYIFFSIRQNILTWPVGLLTSILYVWVFLGAKLYAELGLQIYYVVISIYGWYEWLYGNQNSNDTALKVSRLTIRLGSVLALITALISVLIWIVLKNYTDSNFPVAGALAQRLVRGGGRAQRHGVQRAADRLPARQRLALVARLPAAQALTERDAAFSPRRSAPSASRSNW